ncbi:MAG: peroxiredoxin [Candidatus Azotimanducaceae bacterium]|jgi:peroxiredoxin
MKKTFIAIIALLASAVVNAVELEDTVPDFTLKSMGGQNLRLEEFRGQVVLINFWASWCGPCRQEMPILQKIHERYEPLGFTVLGINVDDNQEKARKIAERLNLNFPLLLDTGQFVSEAYDVNAMPYSVLVSRDGKINYIHRGYKPGDENQYVNRLKQLLRVPATQTIAGTGE